MTKQLLISGRVQGVGFRAFTQRQALELALVGWVRNLLDGRVEVLVRGTGLLLDQLETKLRKGPQLAEVSHVTAKEVQSVDPWTGFVIERDGEKPWAKV